MVPQYRTQETPHVFRPTSAYSGRESGGLRAWTALGGQTGQDPVLSSEEARKLLDSIETNTLIGPRDRALIGTMVYSFARVGATITMKVGDYPQHRKCWWLRLHEKGGKRNEVIIV
jgi:hypothetical protein